MRRTSGIFMLTLFMVFVIAVTGAVADEGQPAMEKSYDLSLEEAIERALRTSTTLEKAEKDVDRAWEVRKTARAAYASGPIEDLYTSIPGADDHFIRFLSSSGQWEISKKTREMTEDAIILQAKGNYYDIIKKLHELETGMTSLQKAEADFSKVSARATVDLATGAEVQAAKSLYEMEKSALEKAQADLDNSYRIINKLIGLPLEERFIPITPIEFEKIEVPSLENKVAWALSPDSNPYLWSKKEGYEISKYTWTFTTPDEAGLIDKEKASITYQDARKDTRNKIYELYDNLKALESSYQSTIEGMATAEESLRVAQSMYEVGMITKNEVLAREVDLAKAKDGLLRVKSLYVITGETFEKPWLAFVGGGGANSFESSAS